VIDNLEAYVQKIKEEQQLMVEDWRSNYNVLSNKLSPIRNLLEDLKAAGVIYQVKYPGKKMRPSFEVHLQPYGSDLIYIQFDPDDIGFNSIIIKGPGGEKKFSLTNNWDEIHEALADNIASLKALNEIDKLLESAHSATN